MSFDLKVSALIVGDSYIWRLLKYIDEESEKDVLGKIDRLLNIYREDLNIEFKGKSGGNYKDLREISLKAAMEEKFEVLILMIGGNDLDSGKISPEKLAEEVMEFGQSLIEAELVKYVVITQVVPRDKPLHSPKEVYRTRAEQYNDEVEEMASKTERILFWRHVRMNQRRMLGKDGIHLSNVGNYILYHSLKKALAHVINHLEKGQDCMCSATTNTKRPRAGKKHRKR